MFHRNADQLVADVQQHVRFFFRCIVDADGIINFRIPFVVQTGQPVEQPQRFPLFCDDAVFKCQRFGRSGFLHKLRCDAFPVRRVDQRKAAVVELETDLLRRIAKHFQKTIADVQEFKRPICRALADAAGQVVCKQLIFVVGCPQAAAHQRAVKNHADDRKQRTERGQERDGDSMLPDDMQKRLRPLKNQAKAGCNACKNENRGENGKENTHESQHAGGRSARGCVSLHDALLCVVLFRS